MFVNNLSQLLKKPKVTIHTIQNGAHFFSYHNIQFLVDHLIKFDKFNKKVLQSDQNLIGKDRLSSMLEVLTKEFKEGIFSK